MNCMSKKTKKLVIGALLISLCAVATLIAVPSPFGYINAGDAIVLVCAFTLGPLGAFCAGVGSALADLINGYAVYIPATFLIKSSVSLCAYYLTMLFEKLIPKPAVLKYAVAFVTAELVMAFGYLFYEAVVLGYGIAAIAALPFNLIQGAFGCIGGGFVLLFIKKSNLSTHLHIR